MNSTKLCIRSLHSTKSLFVNSNIGAISKVKLAEYTRVYPCKLVQTDGSSISIRYHLPRAIITIPIDPKDLTEEQKALRLKRIGPKVKTVVKEEIQDTFDPTQYTSMWK